ncbi:hypothetical protein SAMN04487948_10827 [Halogranum amylolyticum]|uniref:Uncharacterized protein n=1 Tax=Halogranum amylolyticum TaxID=660520 RepID=A0A1H8TQP1_9EURY|nr:DUF5787 family protein [Halogranum amylolyticum]SEO92833.1 hypothetical protein SAMN04487948_10827 [Halogranum amylolyticum]
MSEFGFELALCTQLETTTDAVVARQLGGSVADPGRRVVDVVLVGRGPAFDARTRITDSRIPTLAVESDVGVGGAVYWKDAFDCHPERARELTDRALSVGFFERERRGGREYVRQTVRYPDWFSTLTAVENKPDLGTPGDLERQLRTDASLGLFDEVVLATESYVTRAHLNRIPDEVGVWRFDPETGEREVVREAAPLAIESIGVELGERHALRTDVAFVDADSKARARRRVAEKAYGKGWRSYDLPACAHATATADGRPYCDQFDRVVDPGSECGAACAAHVPADPPTADLDALRDERSPWVADPAGVARRQSGLDRFR